MACDIPDYRIASTELGREMLESNLLLADLASEYYLRNDSNPQHAFKDRGLEFVGMGGNSEVWRVGQVAVKLSSPTTGINAWRYGSKRPENLIDQLRFMAALAAGTEHVEGIVIPRQYFAFKTPTGAYLRAEQCMMNWQSLYEWLREATGNDAERIALEAAAKLRIRDDIANPILRLGVMGIEGTRSADLHNTNILVPKDSNGIPIEQLPKCLIDRPSSGFVGHLAVAGVRTMGYWHRHRVPALVPERI